MNDEEMGFMLELTDEEIRTLLYAVQEAIRVWPGFPARPVEEQMQLKDLKEGLFRMTLEMNWDIES